jgi:hypothetical protein
LITPKVLATWFAVLFVVYGFAALVLLGLEAVFG